MSESSAADRAPALERRRFVCPHPDCGAFAQQDWATLLHHVQSYDEPDFAYLEPDTEMPPVDPVDPWGTPPKPRTVPIWRGARCGSCEHWSIWLRDTMVYPHRRTLGEPASPDMPAPARALYEEAAAVAVVSRRAGAALARATLERLLKDLDPTAPPRAKLNQLIERVHSKVSSTLGQLLDVIRVTGNGAVHDNPNPDELVVMVLDDQTGPELLEIFLEVANELVDELITKPRKRQALVSKLPPTKRTAPAPSSPTTATTATTAATTAGTTAATTAASTFAGETTTSAGQQ